MAGAAPQHVVIPRGMDGAFPLIDRRHLCTYCDMRWPFGGPTPPPGFCPPLMGPNGLIANNSFVVCPNPSGNHLQHPNLAFTTHNKWYIMCPRARNHLRALIISQARPVFGRPIIERLPNGTISKVNNANNFFALGVLGQHHFINPNMPQRSMSYLCRICTEDELIHYINRATNANYANQYPPPADAENGFVNTCTCINTCIRSVDPQNPRQADCGVCTRWQIQDQLTNLAMFNRDWLRTITHARGGVRMRADNTIDAVGNPGLAARRDAANRDIPCRCGRDAIAPVVNPVVLWCLACQGVKIDPTQVRLHGTRRQAQPIAPRNIASNWPIPIQLVPNSVFSDDYGAPPRRTVSNGRN